MNKLADFYARKNEIWALPKDKKDAEAHKMRQDGAPYEEIGRMFGVSSATAKNMCKKHKDRLEKEANGCGGLSGKTLGLIRKAVASAELPKESLTDGKWPSPEFLQCLNYEEWERIDGIGCSTTCEIHEWLESLGFKAPLPTEQTGPSTLVVFAESTGLAKAVETWDATPDRTLAQLATFSPVPLLMVGFYPGQHGNSFRLAFRQLKSHAGWYKVSRAQVEAFFHS